MALAFFTHNICTWVGGSFYPIYFSVIPRESNSYRVSNFVSPPGDSNPSRRFQRYYNKCFSQGLSHFLNRPLFNRKRISLMTPAGFEPTLLAWEASLLFHLEEGALLSVNWTRICTLHNYVHLSSCPWSSAISHHIVATQLCYSLLTGASTYSATNLQYRSSFHIL